MTANIGAADGIDHNAQHDGQQRATIFAEALSTFFQPTVDVAQTIRAVVAQQQALNQEIDALNQKMGVAAVLPSQQQQQQLDQYVQKLRLAKQRVEMLSKILIAVKGRLWRVHSTLQSKTRVLDAENQQLAAQIVSEQQEQHQQQLEASQTAPQTDEHQTEAREAATIDSSAAEVAPRSPLMRNDTIAPHAADEKADENAVAQQPEVVPSHVAVSVTLQEDSEPAEAVTMAADVPSEPTADADTAEGNTSAEAHAESNAGDLTTNDGGSVAAAAGPLHDDAAKEQTATEEQPVDTVPSSEPQDAEDAAVVAAPQSNKAQQPSAKKSGKGKKR